MTVKLRYSSYSSKQQHSHGLNKNNTLISITCFSSYCTRKQWKEKSTYLWLHVWQTDRHTHTHTHTHKQQKERKESVQKETGGIQCDYLPQEWGHQSHWCSLCSHHAYRPRSWTGSWCWESAELCWLKTVRKQACKCISNQNGKYLSSQMSFRYFTVKNKEHVHCVKIKF